MTPKKAEQTATYWGWGSVAALADAVDETPANLFRWARSRPRVFVAIARGACGYLPPDPPPNGAGMYIRRRTNMGNIEHVAAKIGKKQMTDRSLRTWAEERPKVFYALVHGINYI